MSKNIVFLNTVKIRKVVVTNHLATAFLSRGHHTTAQIFFERKDGEWFIDGYVCDADFWVKIPEDFHHIMTKILESLLKKEEVRDACFS